MRFKTHFASGLLTFFILNYYFPFKNTVYGLLLCLLFSILPDIDLHTSYIGKKFKILSFLFEIVLGHRGIIHSLWLIIVLLVLIYPYGYAFTLIAYVVHLLLDSMTTKGIKWFWPFVRICGQCESGKLTDFLLFCTLMCMNVFLFLMQYWN